MVSCPDRARSRVAQGTKLKFDDMLAVIVNDAPSLSALSVSVRENASRRNSVAPLHANSCNTRFKFKRRSLRPGLCLYALLASGEAD